MSATGRSEVRHPDDFYETPAWAVHALTRSTVVQYDFLDPCAGTGGILRAIDSVAQKDVLGGYAWEFNPRGIEVDPERALGDPRIEVGDFLTWVGKASDIVMNPPYSKAQNFVEHAIKCTKSNVHALLRLSFLEGLKRSKWLRGNMPERVAVLSRRPSFTGKGTDACAYAWFSWSQFPNSSPAQMVIL